MAVGQAVLSPESRLSVRAALADRLEARERTRSAAHAAQLRDALEMLRLDELEGFALSTPSELALLLSCSEWRAADLLLQARLLAALPDGLAALDDGRLTVEQAGTAARALSGIAVDVRAQVWRRLLEQLAADARAGVVRPPRRLRELLDALVIEADPEGAAQRRRDAARDDDVTYDRRDDGLVDLHAFGLTGPDAQACLSRIADHAEPAGDWDVRSAGQRRRDAVVELLTGRRPLDACAGHGCGCPPGAGAPCGAQVLVHVPLATALGVSDVPGELVGHGPIEPDLLAQLLLNAPALRAVFVDDGGIPLAVSEQVVTPRRHDRASVREALLRLVHLPPGERFPRSPDDHPEPPGSAPAAGGDDPPPGEHTGGPGPPSIRPRLRRFVAVRRPRCEWPGCGARASRCDLDHDEAWPEGPTCACNLGPLCRRHHRIKQTGWGKVRVADGRLLWTNPSGRTWTSPAPHPAPPVPVRPLLPVVVDVGSLSPAAMELERWSADPGDPRWDGMHADPAWLSVDPEVDPQAGTDVVGDRLRSGAARWDLELLDDSLWRQVPPSTR